MKGIQLTCRPQRHIRNSIHWSRYRTVAVSHFPQQLVAQFSQPANAYFPIFSFMLVIAELSLTEEFTHYAASCLWLYLYGKRSLG